MKDNIYLNEFDTYLKNEKKSSESTRQSYLRDLGQFLQFYRGELLSAETDDLNGYIAHLRNDGRSAATVARNIASLKAFYKYCFIVGCIKSNPALGLATEKIVQRSPEVLNSREVELLLDQPRCTDLKGYRDKAMLELLYATGIRVSELIALRVADVDLQNGTILCKGSKTRLIPLSPSAVKAVTEYMAFIRKQMVRDFNEEILFVNVNGAPMTRQGFWKILKGYQIKAGIEKNITPHILRHSFAVHLLENGNDMKSVRKIMGQSETAASGIYADFVRELDGKPKKNYNR